MNNPYTEATDWSWDKYSISVSLHPDKGIVIGVSDDTQFTTVPVVPPAVARRFANYLLVNADRVEAAGAGGWGRGAIVDNTFDDGLMECKYIYDCTRPDCECTHDRMSNNCECCEEKA